ncbi:arginyltransferase [Malaciobacter molluscorum LMG 25693]|uniref:Aspartate/glutamate leucyltransferase n=1 Tax=Malaciobacter molluscorum LMG 25693 TaxID=870501 RepID=A0A2G1DEM0_9BACT|nr:arginyltransferase [Malaciobacter molluscorum]AXX93095.1 arginyltransferase [Malaciobacter molluscorum LMG 25693]PHO16938.1 arginyltransferase [Malaciobacter molluscorum LMG 25693]RXJ95565.1 arginyltransferase [Malaciobacter molluscorum]
MHILNEDLEFVEENRECSYFDNEISDMRYRYINHCTVEDYQNMLEHGWRRFGKMHFVPECKGCTKCISMRIDVKNYKFSKSEKRVISKNNDTKLYIQTPTITKEHLDLYDKYHRFMNEKKQWPYQPITPDDYVRSYVQGKDKFTKEFLYFKDEKLVAVALVDILPKSISAIYCFYDHDYADLSLGKFSILAQIKIAKELDIPYIYLGYWIKNHYSMGYKELYKPFEILKNRASLEEETIWEKYEL